MDDKFLYQNRPPVRAGFGESLYARITNDPPRKNRMSGIYKLVLRIGLVCLFVLGVLFTFSQPVRASMLAWVKQIAGLEVQEQDVLPLSESKSVSIPPDARDSLAGIQKDLPYQLALPAYVPDGFAFEDKVDVKAESVFMRWLNKNGDEILMLVDTDHGQRYVTGTDAGQEIQVNGQPALLVQGNYDANGNWDAAQKMLNLIQRKDKLIYWLIYIKNSEGEFDNAAIKAELIRMMGSIP